jgi:hypothetical protein
MIAVGCALGVNADTQESSKQVQKTLEEILSKTGISVGGEFKSQYLRANIGGAGSDSTKRTIESNEFTSVDFDIKARPNENIAGRVIFRMHQNWQNFYSDISNPIFTRWISIDGGARDMFRFNVGDYRAQYSPLTLYTPEVDIMYEPYLFARQRQIAMDEVFVGNNDRLLQGVNFGFDAEIAPLFNEFHYSLSAARLRSTETNIQNGSLVANKFEVAKPLSNYFIGNNLDMTFLKGVNLGGSLLFIADHKGSYRQSSPNDTVFADTAAQFTSIISARPQVDIAKFLGNDALTLKLGAEAAFSLDDSTWFDDSGNIIYTTDASGNPDTLSGGTFPDTLLLGAAIKVDAIAGFSSGDLWEIKLNTSYIMNNDLYRNELAQSPAFLPSRIMNIENDNPAVFPSDTAMHYSTFDALYNTVFKFAPQAQSNRWSKAPFMKTSWTRSIYNQNELRSLIANGAFDPSLQLVMPFGPATPNRQGISADVSGSFLKNAIDAKAVISVLNEKDLDSAMRRTDSVMLEIPATKFSQMGGGIKVDVSKFLPDFLRYPLEISGSMVLTSAINDGLPDSAAFTPNWKITSSFLNAGLYWKFFKRAALLGGIQLINNTATFDTAKCDQSQMHWSGGVEWKVSPGAEVVVSYGQIGIDNDETNRTLLRKRMWAVPTAKDFTQDLVDVSLRVKF